MKRPIKIILICLAILLYGCEQWKLNTEKTSNKALQAEINAIIQKVNSEKIDKKTKIKYLVDGINKLDAAENTKENRDLMFLIANEWFVLNDKKVFFKCTKILERKLNLANDTLGLGDIFYVKSLHFNQIRQNDSSYFYILKAEKNYSNLKDKITKGNFFYNKSIIQTSLGDYLGAESSMHKSYKYLKEENNPMKMYGYNNQLGLIYNELYELERAIYHHKKALEIVNSNKDSYVKTYKSACYNNIGYLYNRQGKYDKAILSFKKALEDSTIKENDLELYGLLIDNLAYAKMKSKDFKNVENMFFEALNIKMKFKGYADISTSYLHLSEYYFLKNNPEKAHFYAEKSLHTAKKSKLPTVILSALKQTIIVDDEKKLDYYGDFGRTLDSLHATERKSRERLARIQLETDQIAEEKDRAVAQKWIVLGIALFLILIGVLIFIIYRQQSRQKELLLIQTQQRSDEKIYELMLNQKSKEEEARHKEKKRIALELHDGVMNKLASTRLNLSVLSKNRDDATIESCINQINNLQEIEKEVRFIAHDLNNDIYKPYISFAEMLEDLLEEIFGNTEIAYHYKPHQSVDWTIIENHIKLNVYRIIQEAAHNCVKHSKAKRFYVNIVEEEFDLSVSLADDGIGFQNQTESKGIGIQNMEERVRQMKGKITINSNPNSLTAINISIPLYLDIIDD